MASLSAKWALVCGILHGRRAFCGPLWVALEITRRCNIRCLGCFGHPVPPPAPAAGPAPPDLDEALLERIAGELPRAGTGEVILVGNGEPLLHPRWSQVVRTLKRAGLEVEMFTNGTLLDAGRAAEIVRAGVDRLNVTFWSVNPEEHARWHPEVPLEMLEQRIRGLALLREARRKLGSRTPRLIVQMPLSRYSAANLEGRSDLALRARPEMISFGYFRDAGGRLEHLMIGPAQAAATEAGLELAARRLASAGIRARRREIRARLRLGPGFWRRLPCYAAWFAANILCDGAVLPCGHCTTAMGNLRVQSFGEIWNGPRYRAFRRQASVSGGLASMSEPCDCENCCLAGENYRLHRALGWLAGRLPWRQAA